MKHCFPAITFFILTAFVIVSGQTAPEPTKRVVQGTVEVENDCPVELSDARMEILENQPLPHRSLIAQEMVEITNRSHLDIKSIGLAFIHEYEGNGMSIGLPLLSDIKAGGARTAIQKMSFKTSMPTLNATLKVRVTGVSFVDGTRWVPPRSVDLLMISPAIRHADAPLQISNFIVLENNQVLTLRMRGENVTAYRLGVVKDTPQEYSLRLGEWVQLDASNMAKGKEKDITAKANQTGLKPAEIFKQEYYTKYAPTWQASKIPHGVAMFVAEVKFADGTIWKQDLRREYLIWSER